MNSIIDIKLNSHDAGYLYANSFLIHTIGIKFSMLRGNVLLKYPLTIVSKLFRMRCVEKMRLLLAAVN